MRNHLARAGRFGQRLFSSLTARKPAHRRSSTGLKPGVESLESRDLLTVFQPTYVILGAGNGVRPLSTTGPTGTSPTQIKHAYGFDQISFNGTAGDGTGTTIAIVDAYDDPNISNDLHQFDARFGLPDPPSFKKVNENGGTSLPAANGGWIGEIALDVEWVHAIAPKASILLVEANTSNTNDMFQAVRYAASCPGVVAVSMSWASGEFSGETGNDSGTFVTPKGHTGVTFVASSGDWGAPPVYPSVSPNVLAVGGTTLSLTGSGNIISESGWSGSGGGISSYENQPSYQKGVVTQSSTRRTTPDVAYNSNPNTGFPVCDSYNNGTGAPWVQYGGTSDAAPQWAALIAIADQGRGLAGLAPLDGPSQTLPALYQLPGSDFHDITGGTSTGSPNYSARSGYDLVTGRGTPAANLVVNGLVLYGAIGPHVTAATPVSDGQGGITGITLTFNEAVQASSFTLADIDTLAGSAGAITPTGITQVSTTQFTVTFATLTTADNYTLTIGPNIIDSAGYQMDQNGNGVNGEDPGDRYTTTFGLALPVTLPVQVDFADGVAHGFISQAGAWSVSSGSYSVTPAVVGADAVSLLPISGTLPSSLEFDAAITANPKANGYATNAAIIFDYQGPTNFKFAVGYFGSQQWTIGHRDISGWQADTIINDSTMSAGTAYNLQLLLQGSTATLLVNGTARASVGYVSAFTGSVGLATKNGVSQFDNVQVRQYPNSGTLPIQQDFSDGIAHDFMPQAGAAWAVANGSYGATPTVGADAVSLLQVNGALPTNLEFDVTLTAAAGANGYASNGGIIFDYQSPTNFKYAFGYFGKHQWIIGHRNTSGWQTDAVVSDNTMKAATAYSLQLLLQGSAVTLLVNGVSKVNYTFGSAITGSLGLGTQNSVTQFDNLRVQ